MRPIKWQKPARSASWRRSGRAFSYSRRMNLHPCTRPTGFPARQHGLKKGITMERRYRLQKNKAFQYVYHRGKSVACRDLVMLFAKGRGLQVGFSVSKKVGNAVTRNLVKRRLRECFRPYLGDVKSGLYVVVARPSAAEATFQSLQKDVRYLLRKQAAFKEANKEGNRA